MSDELLDTIRETSSDHPFLIFIGTASALLAVTRARRGAVQRDPANSPATLSLVLLAALAIAIWYTAVTLWYVGLDAYYDLAEPTITAVSWIVRMGGSPYHTIDAAERYAHIYGPMLFAIHALALALLGGAIWPSKCIGVAAALASVFTWWQVCRRRADSHSAFWLAVCLLLYLAFGNTSFWTRAEPLLLLCVALALSAAMQGGPIASTVMVGTLMGIAVNLKLTGVLYLAPVIALMVERLHARAVWVVVIGGVVAALPFVAWPAISAADYWLWLQLSSNNGVRLALLRPNIEWTLYLMAPLGLWLRHGVRPAHPTFLVVLCLAISAVVVLASKPGAGPYHLLPFVPLILWSASGTPRNRSTSHLEHRLKAAYVLAVLPIVVVQQFLFVQEMRRMSGLGVSDDIRAFRDSHPTGTVAMGYSGTSIYRGAALFTFFRPLLTFDGGAYMLDAPAIQEHQLAGIDIPSATIEALKRCDVHYWLLPSGEEPFATRNMYAATGHRPLFSEAFRNAFADTYRRSAQTAYFDVYACARAHNDTRGHSPGE